MKRWFILFAIMLSAGAPYLSHAQTGSGDAEPEQRQAVALSNTKLYSEIASNCAVLDLKTWAHPTRKTIEAENAEIERVELCNRGQYPVFYLRPSFDTESEHGDFVDFLNNILKSNYYWPFSVVNLNSNEISDIRVIDKRISGIENERIEPGHQYSKLGINSNDEQCDDDNVSDKVKNDAVSRLVKSNTFQRLIKKSFDDPKRRPPLDALRIEPEVILSKCYVMMRWHENLPDHFVFWEQFAISLHSNHILIASPTLLYPGQSYPADPSGD